MVADHDGTPQATSPNAARPDQDLWQGLAGAVLTLTDARGQVVATTTTDHQGRAGSTDLPAGTCTLTAAGYAPVATTVTLHEDTTTTDVRLGTR